MSESAVVEATASEVPVVEAGRGALVTLTPEQRSEYRKTGELPKAGEAAPSTESIETKPAAESETAQSKQGVSKPKPKPTAEERIAQLESTIEKIRKGAGVETKPKAESATAKPEPKPFVRSKPVPDATNADGTPKYETHEEYLLDLTDWRWEEREAKRVLEERQSSDAKSLNEKIEEARSRYDNVDEVIQPAANEIWQDAAVPQVIKTMIGDSDVIVDLVYTLGSNKEELAKFIKMAKETPGKAIRYIALTESLIAQELADKAKPNEPAKPRTQAPKPPTEAGGRAATPPDSLQAALEGSGGKLSPEMKAEFLRRDLAKLKG